jgi:LysM repeat protein
LAGRELQAALAGLLGLALVLILVVRFSGGSDAGTPGGSSSPRPSAAATVTPSTAGATSGATSGAGASVAPSAAGPSAPASAGPTANATPRPTKTPAAARTYKVKSGDTLSAIAARYKTTVATLMQLNNITDPRTLKVGQILKLP